MRIHICKLVLAILACVAFPLAGAQQRSPVETTTQLIVKFRNDAVKAALPPAQRVAQLAKRTSVPLRHVRDMATGASVVAVDHAMTIPEAESVASSLASDPDVEYAEPDRIRKPLFVPDNP